MQAKIKLHIKSHSKAYTLYPQKLIPTHRNQYLHQYPWEISIVGQIVAAMVFDGPDPLDLCLDRVHNPDFIHKPDNGGLPIAAADDSFQRFISRNLIAAFFTANSHYWVRKESVIPTHLNFYHIGVSSIFSFHTSKNQVSLASMSSQPRDHSTPLYSVRAPAKA